jgi:hypothetical protein
MIDMCAPILLDVQRARTHTLAVRLDTIRSEFVVPVLEDVNGFYRYAWMRGVIVICENVTCIWFRRGARTHWKFIF